jgi:hypothetical protein
MTKARDLSDIFADANTANELVKLDGTAKLIDAVFPSVLPAIDGSNLTGVAETKPTITSISPNTIDNTQTQIVITGTNFEITPNVELISTTGVITLADTVTRNSATQLTINATLVDGTYFIRIENPNGLAVRSSTALLTVSDAPTWSTSAGSLGSVAQGSAGSFTVVATSDSAVTYSITSGDFTNWINFKWFYWSYFRNRSW